MIHDPAQPALIALARQLGSRYDTLQLTFQHTVGMSLDQFLLGLTDAYFKRQVNFGPPQQQRGYDPIITTTEIKPGKRGRSSNVQIQYALFDSLIGPYLIAETDQGMCALLLTHPSLDPIQDLYRRFQGASIHPSPQLQHTQNMDPHTGFPIPANHRLHLIGTPFQIQVWTTLLGIPFGGLCSYQSVARNIKSHPRAVAKAIGANPIAVLIPCHRVVRQSFNQGQHPWGGYYWGLGKKGLLIGKERHAVRYSKHPQ